jgi:hypothetical protein
VLISSTADFQHITWCHGWVLHLNSCGTKNFNKKVLRLKIFEIIVNFDHDVTNKQTNKQTF